MKIRSMLLGTLVCGLMWVVGISVAGAKEMTPLDIPMIGDIEMLKIGDTAPQFTLEDLDGNSYSVGGGGEKAHLLVFWSIFCEPCKAEMPLIQRLYEEFNGKGLEVLAVAMDGEPMKKSIQGLVKQQGYTFPVFIDKLEADESFVAADPYGVAGTPTLYVLDKAGKVQFAEVGRVSREMIEEAVRNVLLK